MRRRAVPVIDAALQVLSRRFGTAATVAAALGTIAATAVLMCAMWFACRVLGAADPDFRGQPFNWVTMPDQLTRGALDRVLRAEASRPRLLAPVALLLSHAAWVPVPRLLDRGDLGDGSVFNGMAAANDHLKSSGATPSGFASGIAI